MSPQKSTTQLFKFPKLCRALWQLSANCFGFSSCNFTVGVPSYSSYSPHSVIFGCSSCFHIISCKKSTAHYLLSTQQLTVSNQLVSIVDHLAAEDVQPSDKHFCHVALVHIVFLCDPKKIRYCRFEECGTSWRIVDAYFQCDFVTRCPWTFPSHNQFFFFHTLQITHSACAVPHEFITILESDVLPLHIFTQAKSPHSSKTTDW